MPQALESVRVLDFTQMMLGPFGTQLLADLGADVIKIERPGGEWERGLEMMGELVGGTDSAAFLAMNRNKRSVALNLKDALAREALLRLGQTCDVVVENFRPGVLDRLGLGYEDFRARRDDIIYCSGTGWGRDTAMAREGRPGQDLLIQAMSGIAAAGGRADDPPTPAGTSVIDHATALTLSNAILAALFARERHGIGQRVEVDLYSTAIAMQCQEISVLSNQDRRWERSAAGVGQAWLSAPFGVYRTTDGWIGVAMAPLDLVAQVLGRPELRDLDAWTDRDRVKTELDKVFATMAAEQAVALLLDGGIWAARVRETTEAVQELRDHGSELLVRVDHPAHGTLELVGCPIQLSETPWQQRLAPPLAGEHSREVLADVLGEDELRRLLGDGTGR